MFTSAIKNNLKKPWCRAILIVFVIGIICFVKIAVPRIDDVYCNWKVKSDYQEVLDAHKRNMETETKAMFADYDNVSVNHASIEGGEPKLYLSNTFFRAIVTYDVELRIKENATFGEDDFPREEVDEYRNQVLQAIWNLNDKYGKMKTVKLRGSAVKHQPRRIEVRMVFDNGYIIANDTNSYNLNGQEVRFWKSDIEARKKKEIEESTASKNATSQYSSSKNWKQSSSTTEEETTEFDPDDHDIDLYYKDYQSEFEDIDDAYDDFEDNDEYWDDY